LLFFAYRWPLYHGFRLSLYKIVCERPFLAPGVRNKNISTKEKTKLKQYVQEINQY
jgi:hypothetical protein